MHGDGRIISYGVLAVVVIAIIVYRMRGLSRARPLKLERLWIAPTAVALLGAVVLVESPPQGTGWLLLVPALAVGGALGWLRGSTMAIAVEPETHALNVRASPVAILFVLVLVALRYGLRSLMVGNAGSLHLTAALITDIFLAFAVGLVAVQRIEMAIRARRLLAAARGLDGPRS